MMFKRLEITNGRLAISTMKPVAMIKASAAVLGNSSRIILAAVIGVSRNAAPS